MAFLAAGHAREEHGRGEDLVAGEDEGLFEADERGEGHVREDVVAEGEGGEVEGEPAMEEIGGGVVVGGGEGEGGGQAVGIRGVGFCETGGVAGRM